MKNVCSNIHKFLKRHHYDVFFGIIILLAIVFDSLFLTNIISSSNLTSFYDWFKEHEIYEIVSILVPVLDNIVSLIITTSTTKVGNVLLSDFRKLRGEYEYNPFFIESISVLLLICSVIAAIFDMAFLVIVSGVIAIFYTIYFLVKEMPLVALYNKRIKKIVAQHYIIDTRNIIGIKGTTQKDKNDINMIKIISYFMIKDGINEVYKMIINGSKQNLNEYDVAMDLIKKLDDAVSCYINGLPDPLESSGIDIRELIYNSCDCVLSLIDCPNNEIYKALMVENNSSFLNKTRQLIMDIQFDIESFCPTSFEPNMQYIIFSLMPNEMSAKDSDLEKMIRLKLLNSLLWQSLCAEDLFVYHHLHTIFNARVVTIGTLGNSNYFIFSSVYLFYAMNDPNLTDSFRSSIKNYLSDVVKDDLKTYLSINSRYFTSNFCVDLLLNFVKCMSCSDSINSWILTGSKTDVKNVIAPFTLEYLFDWWFAFLFTGEYIISRDAYYQIASSLSEQELNEFKRVYHENWENKSQEEIDNKPIAKYFDLIGFGKVSRSTYIRYNYFLQML